MAAKERGRGPPQPLHLRLLAEAKDTITKRSTSKKCSFDDVVGWAPPDKRPMKHFKYFHIVCFLTSSILAESERSLRRWSCPSQPIDENLFRSSSRSFLPARRCRPASRAGERASVSKLSTNTGKAARPKVYVQSLCLEPCSLLLMTCTRTRGTFASNDMFRPLMAPPFTSSDFLSFTAHNKLVYPFLSDASNLGGGRELT